jgi:hypothetical protein
VTIAPPRWRAIVFRAARDEEGAAKVDGLNAIPLIRFDFGEWSRVEDPWLVMTMSSEPVRRNASSTIRSASSGRVTSPAAGVPPSMSAVIAAACPSTSAHTTCAPSAMNAAQHARPIPPAAPVTSCRLALEARLH